MFKPYGVYPAMLNPYSADGTVNENELRRLVTFLIDKKVDGLFPCSSVGEAVHMSFEQKVKTMQIVVDQNQKRVPIVPGIGSSNAFEAIALAKEAAKLKCDAVIAAPPFFFPVSDGVMTEYFLKIANESPLPLMIYNIPLFSKPISYSVYRSICTHPNIVGMKDSSGSTIDMMNFICIAEEENASLNILCGREEALLSTLEMGGKGCFTASTGIIPEVMVGIYRSWEKGDLKTALELQKSMIHVIRSMFGVQFPLGCKYGMEARGFDLGRPWQALSPEEAAAAEKTKAIITENVKNCVANCEKILSAANYAKNKWLRLFYGLAICSYF